MLFRSPNTPIDSSSRLLPTTGTMSFSDNQRLKFTQMMAEAIRMATPQNMGEGTNCAKETSVWTNKLREFSGGDDYIDFR